MRSKFRAWLDQHFVAGWTRVLKCASSVRLAVVAGTLVTILLEFPGIPIYILTAFAGSFWGPVFGVLVVLVATYFRLRADKGVKTEAEAKAERAE